MTQKTNNEKPIYIIREERSQLATEIIILLLVAGLWFYFTPTDKDKELSWISQGKYSVKLKLNDNDHDNDSVIFRNVSFRRGAGNLPLTCGEVNSKDSHDNYTGFQKFVSSGKPELTFLQEDIPNFESFWKLYCK